MKTIKQSLALSLTLLISFSSVQTVPAADGELRLPPYKKITLKNGMTVLLMEQREVPIINFEFIVKSGSVADPKGKEGVASITAALLRKGTRSRTADQISAEIDFIGGQMGAAATYDYTNGSAEFLKKDMAKGFELFADVLLNPVFPQAEVTKILTQQIDGIKSAKDQAQGVISAYFSSYLYGAHPYSRPEGGDEKSLAAITRDDIVKHYETYYAPSNTILAVVGDFNAAEMERMISDRFGAWEAKTVPAMSVTDAAPVSGKKLLLVDKPDSTQTFFQIGNIGVSRTHTDRVYIDIINTLFGGRFTSMLNSKLRIETGLTYGARSSFTKRKARGPFAISSYTQNKTTEQAMDMALAILKDLHEKGITEEQLKSAKNYIKGQFPPSIETSDQIAALLAELEFYGLDQNEINGYYAKIDSMTVSDARRVIKEHFPLENLVFVLIGKAEEIQSIAKKYAPKQDTKAISQPGF